MDIIRKDKYNIIYNHYNDHIPTGIESSCEEASVREEAVESDADGESKTLSSPILTEQMIQVKEEDLMQQKKRVREKQKLFLELIKQ